jgi:glyoxylase-like metal-dependent hydrolase (beta-lactamase superfamily II)
VNKPEVFAFYESDSNTISYIVKDPQSNACAIIDSVLDFDYAGGKIGFDGADLIINCVREKQLEVSLHIETHVHADHLSAAPYIQSILGGKIAIGKNIAMIQDVFGKLFNDGTEFQRDGSQFDILFDDNDEYQIGNLKGVALLTPGHTPACMTHLIGDAAFVGDTLFMPDAGTARADFPGGDARTLYKSIQRVLALPPETRLYMCHDYQPNGRQLAFLSTVADHIDKNIHVKTGITEEQFVSVRETRDKTLGMPRLIYPALQVNMRAGHFPPAENNETVYLKVPISGLKAPLI